MNRIAVFGVLGSCLVGCGGVPEVEPVPAAAPVAGDANGDGHIDISDAVFLSDYLFRRGPNPACDDAADAFADGQLAAADLWVLLSAAMPGETDLKALDADQCADAVAATPPAARKLALHIDAPKKVEASGGVASFEATVTLDNPGGGVSAWQLSVAAEGCAVTAVRTEGTDGASIYDDPPGQRGRTSWDWHAVSQDGGAVAGVVLDWRDDVVLAPSQEPYTLLSLTVAANPTDGCQACTLALRGGQRTDGPYSRNLVTIDAWSYLIGGESVTIKVCG